MMVAPAFLVFLMLAALGIGVTILWIWVLVDCATKEPPEGNDKLVWVLIIVLAGWIGALIYLFARRPSRIEQFGA